jgi:hypothetical protein
MTESRAAQTELEEYGWPDVTSFADATFWLRVMHRRTRSDIDHINRLYERITWLSQPWWRRAFRRPPWQTR